jgi:hypothetical protein
MFARSNFVFDRNSYAGLFRTPAISEDVMLRTERFHTFKASDNTCVTAQKSYAILEAVVRVT